VRGEAKNAESFKAGYPAYATFYAAMRRPSPYFSIHNSKFTILWWCLECSSRKKALLPNEAKLFAPKTDCNKLSINSLWFSRFGSAFQNKGVQLHVSKPRRDEKWQFPAPNQLQHTTTCSAIRLGIPLATYWERDRFGRIRRRLPGGIFPPKPLHLQGESASSSLAIGVNCCGKS
jgi:hypothetical protein